MNGDTGSVREAQTLPTDLDRVNLGVMSILLVALADYDGKQVEVLERILASTPGSRETLDEVITLAASPDAHVAGGATWLLRRYVVDTPLSGDQIGALAALLPDVSDVWARLHICQSVRSLDIGDADADAFAVFIRDCRTSERPFLRAWATDALSALASRHGRFEEEAGKAIAEALSDGAASVRARARRIIDGR